VGAIHTGGSMVAASGGCDPDVIHVGDFCLPMISLQTRRLFSVGLLKTIPI
jgi:hypothetical protein